MFVPFNELPDTSRIWIYQCNRLFSESEASEIKKLTKNFVEEWTAHQQTLHASFDLLYNIFLILAVDEKINDASGCSIDKSVNFIKQIEKHFDVSFFDRFDVAFKNGETVQIKKLADFVKVYKDENLDENLIVFNNLVILKADLKNKWEIPVSQSWVKTKV